MPKQIEFDAGYPDDLPPENARRRLFFLVIPVLVAAIFCASQAGLTGIRPDGLGIQVNALSTADYAPWPSGRFRQVDPALGTQVAGGGESGFVLPIGIQNSIQATLDLTAVEQEEAAQRETRAAQKFTEEAVIQDTQVALIATDAIATDMAATDMAATDVAATDVAATDMAATDMAATDVAATDAAASPTATSTGTTTATATATATSTPTSTSTPGGPIIPPPPPAPIASFFVLPPTGSAPLNTNFIDASQGTITSYAWNFGDGIGTSTAQNPVYVYTTPGSYLATLTVSGPGGSDSFSVTVIVTNSPPPPPPAQADLRVRTNVDDNTPQELDTITYTVRLTNNGPNTASGVQVNNALPSGTTFISASPTNGSYNSGVWSVSNIAPGNTYRLDIFVRINTGTAGSTLTQTSSITASSLPDPNLPNNSDSVNVTVANPTTDADLQLVKTASVPTITVGNPFNYTLTATNNGPVTATGVVISDTLPAQVSFVSSATCTAVGSAVTCNIGNLNNGASSVHTVTVQANIIGTAINNASVSGNEPDPNNGDNNDSASVTITSAATDADLQLIKNASASAPATSTQFTYTFTVTNNGPLNATGVVVTDTLPAQVSFVSSATCSAVGSAVTCNIGNLNNGATTNHVITVLANTTGVAINNASVTASEPDPNLFDNTDSAIVTVQSGFNIGAPDDVWQQFTCPDQQVFNLGGTPIQSIAGPDFVLYERLTGGNISMDWVVVEVGTSSTGPWIEMFNWGDNNPDNNTNMAPFAAGGENDNETIPATNPPLYGTSPLITGITIDIDPIAPGTYQYVRIVVPASGCGTDTDGSELDALEVLTGPPPPTDADLQLTKSASVGTITVGGQFDYTFSVTNNGPLNATGVVISDTLPAEVSFVSSATCTAVGSAVTCNIGNLNNGATANHTITVQANLVGTAINNASVTGNEPDTIGGNNSDNTSVTIQAPVADLIVTQNDAVDPVVSGSPITYTVTVSNSGPNNASSVQLVDVITGNATLVSATPTQGSCTPAGNTATCTLGTINNGAFVTVTVVVNSTAPGSATSTGTASAAETDPNGTNNTNIAETTTINAPPSADLAVTQGDSPDPVIVGNNVTYTVIVNNNGPDTTNAQLVDVLPGGVTYVSAVPTQGSCGESGGTVTCPLGSLANGGSATITIVITTTGTGTITNTASANGSVTDPVPGNSTNITENTTVNAVPPSADLAVSQVDAPDPVVAGLNVTYTVIVTNNGPDSSDATLTDVLPGGVTYVSAVPTQGSCGESGGTVTCPLGTLANGGSATITIVITTSGTGTITNTASATGTVTDPSPGNNTNITEDTTVL